MLFCADAVEHPRTWEYFTGRDAPELDVAFLPAHSAVPRNVLTERELQTSYDDAQAASVTTFDRYVSTMDATVTVPFACGWKVAAEDGELDWCNSTMYPFTPVQARDRLALLGRRAELMPPGVTLTVDRPNVAVGSVSGVRICADVDAAYGAITLDTSVHIPPLDPETDRCGLQRDSMRTLVDKMMDGFVGTDVWCQALERGRRYTLIMTGDAGETSQFVLDPADGPSEVRGSSSAPPRHYVRIAASTLQSLLDGELLYGSSWGLWTSDVALLAAVFHHPRYNMAHLDRALAAQPAASIRNSPAGEPAGLQVG